MEQVEGYRLWEEAEFELGVARDIIEAVNGKGSRRFDDLGETWSHIKQEVKSLEKSPSNREEVESFLQRDSK